MVAAATPDPRSGFGWRWHHDCSPRRGRPWQCARPLPAGEARLFASRRPKHGRRAPAADLQRRRPRGCPRPSAMRSNGCAPTAQGGHAARGNRSGPVILLVLDSVSRPVRLVPVPHFELRIERERLVERHEVQRRCAVRCRAMSPTIDVETACKTSGIAQ